MTSVCISSKALLNLKTSALVGFSAC